jgi:hypothetical protein
MSLRGVLRGRFTKPYQQIHAAEAKGRMESGLAKGGRPGAVI